MACAMTLDLKTTYDRLYAYCAERDFAGHDPFDALNSEVFHSLPLKNLGFARLTFLQIVKRSPVDLRSILRVKEGSNPKALALFALAEMSRFRESGDEHHAANAKMLLDRLSDMKIAGDMGGVDVWGAFG